MIPRGYRISERIPEFFEKSLSGRSVVRNIPEAKALTGLGETGAKEFFNALSRFSEVREQGSNSNLWQLHPGWRKGLSRDLVEILTPYTGPSHLGEPKVRTVVEKRQGGGESMCSRSRVRVDDNNP